MDTTKQILFNLIEEMPDNKLSEIIDFVRCSKLKKEKQLYEDLESADESSFAFLSKDIDNEVWNTILARGYIIDNTL